MFIIYPALDLRGGRVVRLKQGRADLQTVYSNDPAEIAQRWQKEGASWLHVVDLDRALGEMASPNSDALQKIVAAVKIPIQFGGGMRSIEHLRQAFARGMSRVVIGTLAFESPQVTEAVQEFGPEKIAVAIDTRSGRVALRGWLETSNVDAVEFGKRMRGLGIQRAIFTDIARDGMLGGVDAVALANFARATGLGIIASGGIASLDDLRALQDMSGRGVEGAIVGQALYTGALSLGTALQQTSRRVSRL